jgi:hypothetical protein
VDQANAWIVSGLFFLNFEVPDVVVDLAYVLVGEFAKLEVD